MSKKVDLPYLTTWRAKRRARAGNDQNQASKIMYALAFVFFFLTIVAGNEPGLLIASLICLLGGYWAQREGSMLVDQACVEMLISKEGMDLLLAGDKLVKRREQIEPGRLTLDDMKEEYGVDFKHLVEFAALVKQREIAYFAQALELRAQQERVYQPLAAQYGIDDSNNFFIQMQREPFEETLEVPTF